MRTTAPPEPVTDGMCEFNHRRENTMASSNRRFFIIRAQQAKRARFQAANENAPTTITVGGRTVAITDANRRFAETLIARDAEQAFEAAVYRRPYESRVAIAA